MIFRFLIKKPSIDTILLSLDNGLSRPIDILRLDNLHPTISGNKWYKLKYNLVESEKLKADSIVSFGGAFSNHLHALAYAGQLFNIKTIGIVRGEEVANPTLNDCKKWGMELHFVSRVDYKRRTEIDFLEKLQNQFPNAYIIPEGGDNELGEKGCTEILTADSLKQYDVICCSIGTGATIKGIAQAFQNKDNLPDKQVWGFAPLKNVITLQETLRANIPQLTYIDDYHFGGFGKVTNKLLQFQQDFAQQHSIALDKIYTAKMFYGMQKKLTEDNAHQDKKILAIHTGGLQGNRSSI